MATIARCLLSVALGVAGCGRGDPAVQRDGGTPADVTGRVMCGSLPIPGARVRVQTRERFVLTGPNGRFVLPVPDASHRDQPLTITAAKPGYYVGSSRWFTGSVTISLRALPEEDDESYAWIDPTPNELNELSCGNCHEAIWRQWLASGHSRSATNRRLLNLYEGTDWEGQPGVGWSLLEDLPHGAGVCNACHAPAAALEKLATEDIRRIEPAARLGVHCDFCHKIQDLAEGAVGLTHGRFGYRLLRPAKGQVFFGPLDDVSRGEDAYLPLQKESRFCAACHEGILFGVHVYSTYSEWLASPARRAGKHCQSCHMHPTGHMNDIAPGHGGLQRDPWTLANHSMPPQDRMRTLKNAISVTIAPREQEGGFWQVTVAMKARDVGHYLPTGFIDRHIILHVEAHDASGHPVLPREGPRLPAAAGKDLAHQAGFLFAKLLRDEKGNAPVPFWRAAGGIVEDTRLVPGAERRFQFVYDTPVHQVTVRVLYRRFWDEVQRSKKWPDDQTILYETQWRESHPAQR